MPLSSCLVPVLWVQILRGGRWPKNVIRRQRPHVVPRTPENCKISHLTAAITYCDLLDIYHNEASPSWYWVHGYSLRFRPWSLEEVDGSQGKWWKLTIFLPYCISYILKPSTKSFHYPIHCSTIANIVRLCHFNVVGAFLCRSESPSKIWLSSLLISLVAPHETLV